LLFCKGNAKLEKPTIINCCTPYCINKIAVKESEENSSYIFCPDCKKDRSTSVLKAQVDHGKKIEEVILDARLFKSANAMADYIGISFVTMYNWIEKFFNMSFQEFRRTYICKSKKCYFLDIKRSAYSRNDYILKKIRSIHGYCACINSLQPNQIMTNCPPNTVSSILRGYPKINKISDNLFALAPKPILFNKMCPIFFKQKVFPVFFKNA